MTPVIERIGQSMVIDFGRQPEVKPTVHGQFRIDVRSIINPFKPITTEGLTSDLEKAGYIAREVVNLNPEPTSLPHYDLAREPVDGVAELVQHQ